MHMMIACTVTGGEREFMAFCRMATERMGGLWMQKVVGTV